MHDKEVEIYGCRELHGDVIDDYGILIACTGPNDGGLSETPTTS